MSIPFFLPILFGETVENRPKIHPSTTPVFVSPSRYELMVDGRKIVGSAQRRLRRGFLQHGSMPITCDRDLLARATRFEDPAALESEMSGIGECLNPCPSAPDMTSAFVAAFEGYFGVVFERRMGDFPSFGRAPLTHWEPGVIWLNHGREVDSRK